jgi:UDP-N-acetyl-D-mannosaminouronate:lipid I N-acetyl-D-mannosaminouronosyltransferase
MNKMIASTHLNSYKIYLFEDREHFLDYLDDGDLKKILVALNAEKLVKDDQELKALVSENIGYADGIGPVFALKRKGFDVVKIPGAELWLGIVKRFYKEKSFYLIGSREHIIRKTVSKLKKQFPSINIVNFRDGYLNKDEEKEVIADIIQKKPDIVFVAMGSPKQELFMQEMLKQHKALYMGLGGSFDVYTGEKKRAPKGLQNLGLEWSYRLFKEPKRIFRQTSLVTFAYKLLMNKL